MAPDEGWGYKLANGVRVPQSAQIIIWGEYPNDYYPNHYYPDCALLLTTGYWEMACYSPAMPQRHYLCEYGINRRDAKPIIPNAKIASVEGSGTAELRALNLASLSSKSSANINT